MTTPTYPKSGPATKEEQSAGTKRVKVTMLENGQAADIGKAPTSRVYTNDYSKVPPRDSEDITSAWLGNPLRR